MTDQQHRAEILRWFYDHREDDRVQQIRFKGADKVAQARACAHLKQQNLIKWAPLHQSEADGTIVVAGGKGCITAWGVNEIELPDKTALNPIVNDNQLHVHISHSNGFQVGHTNSQEIGSLSINQLAKLIEESETDQSSKDEAKTLLGRFLDHPLVGSILQGAIKGITS